MEDIRLEAIWRQRLVTLGWSTQASAHFRFAWADSTLQGYNRALSYLQGFCAHQGQAFPPASEAVIADFLHTLAMDTHRPKSTVVNAVTAMSNLYKAYGLPDLTASANIRMFANKALVKAYSTTPMERSNVMPVSAFTNMFLSWGDDDMLSIKDLRLKTITLLALCLMLRPSDVAPRGLVFNPTSGQREPLLFTLNNVTFLDDGSAKIRFFGIKNDSDRKGFQISLPSAEPAKIDPVRVLKNYISRTDGARSGADGPVFLTLRAPYRALKADSVAQVLNDAIRRAGLSDHHFSAKDFRPTGATVAIDNGTDPEVAMQIGRWKTRSVFFEHYVHSRPPVDYCHNLLHHA